MEENVQPSEAQTSISPEPTPLRSGSPNGSRLKKYLLGLVAIGLLIGLGYGVWRLAAKNDQKSGPSSESTQLKSEGYISETPSTNTQPAAIVYAQRKDDQSPYEIYRKPFGGNTLAVSALKLETDDYITGFQAVGLYVALSVEGKSGPAVWLSSDSGASYQKVWTGAAGNVDSLGDQITSILFSRDQKRLLFAVNTVSGNNSVKELNLADTQVKDLFTVDEAGVFLKDYDSAKLILHYATGCYNCDGNTGVPLYRRELLNNKQVTVVTATDAYLLAVGVKPDGSELLYALGSMSSEGLGAGAPYRIYQQLESADQPTLVVEEASEYVWAAGYGDDGTGYYVLGSRIYNVSDKKLLFDAESTIVRVGYLSKELIVTESGEYPNLQVASYDIASKKARSLLAETANTTFIGVVEE